MHRGRRRERSDVLRSVWASPAVRVEHPGGFLGQSPVHCRTRPLRPCDLLHPAGRSACRKLASSRVGKRAHPGSSLVRLSLDRLARAVREAFRRSLPSARSRASFRRRSISPAAPALPSEKPSSAPVGEAGVFCRPRALRRGMDDHIRLRVRGGEGQAFGHVPVAPDQVPDGSRGPCISKRSRPRPERGPCSRRSAKLSR